MLSAVGKFFAGIFLRLALAFGLFSAGANDEKKKQAINEAKEARNEAKKWANRPRSNYDTVVRLREFAKHRKDET